MARNIHCQQLPNPTPHAPSTDHASYRVLVACVCAPLRYGGRMPEKQAIELVLQPTLKVLAYLHSQVRRAGHAPVPPGPAGFG